ncbi:hypothetical protein [Sedimentibacter sp.]|uniref:hypothetical protein n=2 Tax=Sedimentibacter sp. TaxID=1960295 RepID=UPI0028A8EDF8|nr:hypothetical protein [Sedimentibacter sp.]
MKNTIINILILILMFNIIMIIFPEGKTQKFCRIAIKIFIMIYILDNIFLSGSININILNDLPALEKTYEREVTLSSIDENFIESINKDYFEGDNVVKNISLSFTEDMDIKAEITLNKLLSFDEVNALKTNIADIFHVKSENIYIR